MERHGEGLFGEVAPCRERAENEPAGGLNSFAVSFPPFPKAAGGNLPFCATVLKPACILLDRDAHSSPPGRIPGLVAPVPDPKCRSLPV